MDFESAAFPGGRFVNRNGSVVPCYYLTDHLGSTRAIVDGVTSDVLERNDYYPFGSRWSSSAGVSDNVSDSVSDNMSTTVLGNASAGASANADIAANNRYLFNGKEEQSFTGLPYIDYGARMYDPYYRLSWNSPDPLAEKYYSVSPYAFCAGNPVNFFVLIYFF